MKWKIIKTETSYKNAVKRTLSIFYAKDSSSEVLELALLTVLIKEYEQKNIHLSEI